jgi:hypothetical protein
VQGSTSAQWVRRAVAICEERLAPLMRAARAAGVAVFHLAGSTYAERYPQYRAIRDDPELQAPPRPPEAVAPTGPIPARCIYPEAQIDHLAKVVGPHYPGRPWVNFPEKHDIARCVRPEPEDLVVLNGWQLHGLCHRRGIHTLLYAGFLADVCLMNVPGAIAEMKERFGYRIIALRDCTTTYEFEETAAGDWMTFAALRRIELVYGYTTDSAAVRAACERLTRLGGSEQPASTRESWQPTLSPLPVGEG